MNDVSKTAMLTLQCHAIDAKSTRPILGDYRSVDIIKEFQKIYNKSKAELLQKKVKKSLVKHITIRAKKYDKYVRDFLQKYPNANIINIGCGFDNRFERIDNGLCNFYDIDFPDLINFKKSIFPENNRYKQFGQSVFDYSWMNNIQSQPTMLLAEGVFMYCEEADVKELFKQIHNNITGSVIAFEVFSSKWLKGWKKKIVDFKLKKQLGFGKDAIFKFGIKDSKEIETWSSNYQLIDDWCYFDEIKKNPAEFLRKIQWTVYYKI